MKLKKTVLLLFFASLSFSAFSQEEQQRSSDHYVGVQINQLIRQVFNFSGTSSVVNNPYLLTYAVNNATGWGASFGLGYTFNESTEGDSFTRRTTKINDFFGRVGFEKKSGFGKHWILSVGGDVVIDLSSNTTTTIQGTDHASALKTETKNRGFGLGPRVTLNYEITERMLIGTEANYYFKSITNTFKNSGSFTSDPEIEEKLKRFQFGAPAVIFLILKF